ncbi:MAG: hypothetical protein ABSB35_05830 [Bryobacteraceae bacterium]|jgi:hypothetical protein
MNNDLEVQNVIIQLEGSGADPEEIDHWTRQLRSELEEMGSSELLRGDTQPQGAKSAESLTIGSVVIMVLPALVPKLVDFLQAYVLRRADRRVKVKTNSFEIELPPKTFSEEEMGRLISALQKGGDSPVGS